MRKLLLATLFSAGLLLALSPNDARAQVRQAGHFGIGVGGGYGVTGLSMKYFMADSHALQGVVGIWSRGLNDGFTVVALTGDYLFEGPALAKAGPLELGWNIGFGPFLGIGDAFWLGISGVLGLEFNIDPVPIDIVLEYRPGILVVPDVDADVLNFTGHIRFYF